MKKILIFGRSTCPVCKDVLNKFQYFKKKTGFTPEIEYIDMDEVNGLTEGAFYEVTDIPTVLIVDEGKELVRWVKIPPVSEEFLPYLSASG